ncbi:MAG: ATP-dependent helicase HrpB [Mangrovicoccus sp.]|nr:ATP-dependent helicase HrpB [Mangrovicoccus sp.]
MGQDLPIEEALPELLSAMQSRGVAVLQAPPGAGKTTRVPLALAEAAPNAGRIVMLEPRRLAARAAAARMADTLGTPLGQEVGYRIRGEAKVSRVTKIEVVTEGVLTRMLQSDPDLPGVGTVIFDEFHERSLQADLGLALSWDARQGLREDLNLLVMSATLDAEPVAAMLEDAPVITSQGRSFPVQTRWLERPRRKTARLEQEVADLVITALGESEGGLLVFLPGEGEIRRTLGALEPRLPKGCVLRPLYGALDLKAQRAAVAPDPKARKIVLATAIAETSLTIEDVRVVVDAGLARRAQFDPGTGMSRLVTQRVTRAEAVQRQGRAGRVAPGLCYRLWTKGEEGGMAAFAPPEIARTDLTGLALELAQWGAAPEDLAFLTPPPEGALAEARALLRDLGALDGKLRLTDHGKALGKLPLHPRLAHMALVAGRQAAPLAALLNDRDPLRNAGVDLAKRLEALKAPHRAVPAARGALERIGSEAKRLAKALPDHSEPMSPGEMAALAYPDRIGLRRAGEDPRWLLSGGRGAVMEPSDALAGARLIVATDLDGAGREARLRQAVEITESALRAVAGDRLHWVERCAWDKRSRQVRARRQECLGALVLRDEHWRDVPPESLAEAALDGVRELGLAALGGQKALSLLRARLAVARPEAADLPDPREDALLASAEHWLLPHLSGARSAGDLSTVDAGGALAQSLSWPQSQSLDRIAPPHYTTPLGRKLAIDYASAPPQIALRLQELFGETRHPSVGGVPLRLELLSPAGRPIAVTSDLPGFWRGGYGDVRKDMRGRYPKHPWPEDPTQADPTLRAKPRR